MTTQALDRRIAKLERRTVTGDRMFHVLRADSNDFDTDAAIAALGIEPDEQVFVVRLVSPTGRVLQ